MKSLTQITIVFIVVNLATAGYVLAQEARLEQLRQADAVSAQRQTELAEKTAQRTAELAAADARAQADIALRQTQYSLALTQARGGAESATAGLLVLTSQTKAENLAMIIEDLNIMSRILDKKVGRAQDSRIALLGEYIRLDSLLRGSHSTTQTQAMYVQGYAALFFMNVDFPLSPPPEVRVERVKEGADPVWEQIKRQITPSDKDLGLEYMHQRDAAARQYDKDVVEQLKTDLVKALKHAANIRNLKPDESVILVVAGTRPGLVVAEHGDEQHRYQYIQSENQPLMLTIRAKKADIDAYAAAKTDYDKFRQRTAILTSRASPGPGRPEIRFWPSQNLQ
jgi:hypothetical protein